MSYTRDCTGCSAKITWNDNQKRYEDDIFPGEKHDHKKYEAAVASNVEASNELFVPPNKGKPSEGKECFVCKKNGFPNEIIFFNEEMKGNKTGKHIPLERPDKVNGQYVTHTHREKDATRSQAVNAPAKSYDNPTEPGNEDNIPHPPVDQESLGEIIKSFTQQLNTQQKWFEDSRDKIDTIVAWILENSVKKADQVK